MTANPSIQANFQTQFIDGLDLIPRLMHKAFEDRRAGYQPGRFAGGVDPHEVPRRPVDTPRGGVSQGLYAPTQSYQPPQTSAGGQYTREGGPGPELGRSQLLAGPIQTTRQPVTGASPSRRFRREKIIDENQRWPEAAWFKPDGGEVERQTSVQQLQRKMTLPNSKNFHKFVHDARSKCDLDRTGKITYREFYSTLNQYTEGVSPQEFQNLVKAYDKEGSGYVQYERLAADLAGLQGESKAQNFHAERVRDQIIRGNGGGFNPLQVRQVLDTVDSRRTGQLDEVQATAALRNMGLAVSNRDASSFLRSVATTHPGSGRYSVEKLAQAISDMAAGQDLRHVKNEKMSKILAAPEPASTESLITIGNEAGTEELRPRRVDLEDGRTRKEKLVWSKMMGRLKSEKDRVYSQLRATAAGSRDGTLSAAEIRDVLRISNTDSTMLFSAAGSRGDRVPVSQVIQLIDAQGTGAVKKLEAGEIFYRRPPEQEKPRGPIKTCNPRGPTILFDPDYINGTQESFLRLGTKKDSRAYDYSQMNHPTFLSTDEYLGEIAKINDPDTKNSNAAMYKKSCPFVPIPGFEPSSGKNGGHYLVNGVPTSDPFTTQRRIPPGPNELPYGGDHMAARAAVAERGPRNRNVAPARQQPGAAGKVNRPNATTAQSLAWADGSDTRQQSGRVSPQLQQMPQRHYAKQMSEVNRRAGNGRGNYGVQPQSRSRPQQRQVARGPPSGSRVVRLGGGPPPPPGRR